MILNILISLLCACSFAYGQVLPEDHYLYHEVEKIVQYETNITKDMTPGYLVGIINQEESYLLSIGIKEPHSTQQLLTSDIFELGSVSKVFTASVIGRLVEVGTLRWEDPIHMYLPDTCKSTSSLNISISDLASHQSGLPKFPPFIGEFQDQSNELFKSYPKSEICAFLNRLPQNHVKKSIYSHLNYAILEMIIEQVTGRSFPDAVEAQLFDPLGMDQTTFQHLTQITPGYDRGGKAAQPLSFQSFNASEGSKSTLDDLVKFVNWNIGLGSQYTFAPSTLREVHEKVSKSNLSKGVNLTHGWHVVHPKKRLDVYITSGQTNGHHASISFCKQTQTGVIVLSNSQAGTDNLGYLILRMINKNWKRKS